MKYVTAASLDDALALATERGTRLVAGGTALQLEWARGLEPPARMVGLGALDRLSGIEIDETTVRIGALTTLAALDCHSGLAAALPQLTTTIRSVAGPAVRNLATIGGNVAGRTGCLLPALLALDAGVESVDAASQQIVPLLDWLENADEGPRIIVSLHIPRPPADCRWTHRKIGLRAAFTPSMIGIAGMLDIADGQIGKACLAAGGGIVSPQRLPRTETILNGQPAAGIDWQAVHASLLNEIAAPDDAFRSGRYRRRVAANALVAGLAIDRPPIDPCVLPAPSSGDGSTAIADPTLLSRDTSAHRWHIRPDGPPKVAGTFAYLTDRREPGMLVGRILRAGHPHARILSIDTSPAEMLPGVAAVVTHRDIAGQNGFGIVFPDQPALCSDKVRYVGDAVAAVAAVDAETASRALGLIRVVLEPLPVVSDPEVSLDPETIRIHESGNLVRRLDFARGSIEHGFAKAAHILEAVYTTPRQMHGFMETEGGHARVEPDGTLTVCVGGQHGARDRFQLSRLLGMAEDRIRVVSSPTGGAFGGKDELTVQPALALLALKSGSPVRLQLDRAESVIAGIKRNPMTIRMKTGIDAQGVLVAQEVHVLADCGAYASLSPAVIETALEHAAGPYLVENILTSGRLAYTNNGTCGAFRGFGANQMAYAVECQMDRLAALCGLDPVEIRRRNLRRPGMPGYLGQVTTPSERLAEMLEAAAGDAVWQERCGLSADGTEVFGTGMALNYQGNGLGTLPPDPAGGLLCLAPDGRIEARYGMDEMGQGLHTSIQSAVASALGCARDDVRPVTGDTMLAPDSGSSTASRGTYVVWKVADLAGPTLSLALLEVAGRRLDRDPATLAIVPGGIAERSSNSGERLITLADLAKGLSDLPSASVSFNFPKADYTAGNARFMFCYGATLARIAVSRITGQVRVTHLVQHTAAGPVLDASAYLGQIEGGGLQGLGFTLSENAAMQDGRTITANLDTYMLPGIADSPAVMRTHALESLDPGDPYGPRGVGELGIGAVTPAIANAVGAAIGAWPADLPIDPEWVLENMEVYR